jgi:hypothetical protein
MNRRSALLVSASTLALALSGCASGPPPKPNFVETPSQTLAPPPADQAQIVFLEPINSIQGMFPVGIFKVEGDQQRTLLAITGSHTKAAVLLPPGRHTLMANMTGIGHFLDVNVEAGKRYYVLVRFIYANGFQLRPLRTTGVSDYSVNNKNFPAWVQDKFVEMTPEGRAYFEVQFKDQVAKSQAAGWKTFQAKTADERAELTLNPQDAYAN